MLHYDKEDLKTILNNLSVLLSASAYVFLIPIIFVLIYNEPQIYLYLYVLLALVVRVFASLIKFKPNVEIERRHAIVSIILFWLIFALFASIPFIVLEGQTFIDGFFESSSALTSTGYSMFASQDVLMHSTLFWRVFLEWLSGIGIVVLAIMGLLLTYSKFKMFAESEGHNEKITSSIKKTVLIFVAIYVVTSLIGIVLLRVTGMPLFDSIYYTFTSISSTGSNMTDAGLLQYNSFWALLIVFGLMVFGAMSFILHYKIFIKKNPFLYFKDKSFLFFIFMTIILFVFVMLQYSKLIPFHTLFYLVSSATGGINLFPISVHQTFPDFFKGVIIFLMFVGASTASTGGGIKWQRFIIILKTVWWKTKEMLLPKNALFQKRFDDQTIDDKVTLEVLSYTLMFVLFILLGTFILIALGYNALDSLLEITSAQSNIGFETGIVTTSMPLIGKIVFILNMFIGRLEIIPILVLFGFLFNIRLWKK